MSSLLQCTQIESWLPISRRLLGPSNLRLFAVNFMRSVVRHTIVSHLKFEDPIASHVESTATMGDETGLQPWCIQTLVTQLNAGEPAIVRAVLSVLEEAAQDQRCLRTLVSWSVFWLSMP